MDGRAHRQAQGGAVEAARTLQQAQRMRLERVIVAWALVFAPDCGGRVGSATGRDAGEAGGARPTDAGATPGARDAAADGPESAAHDASADALPRAHDGAPLPPVSIDLCAGLIEDKQPRPMSALGKPAIGETVTDAEFGTKIRRVTGVGAIGGSPAIRPLYSTVSAWNADESRLLLLDVEGGGHVLYDGRTYAFIRGLGELRPPDVEQLYWHTSDPDLLLYVEGRTFVRYHVERATKETVTTFDFCASDATGGSDPMFMSFDSHRIGLRCDDQVFIYDVTANAVIARKTIGENPAQVAPSGTLAYLSDTGRVTDARLAVVRTLDLREPFGHASLGRLPSGEDTWNGQVFDEGPNGNDDIGTLVTWDLTTGNSRVIIGPKTGWPYPPDGHVSAMAYRQPGWVFVSTFGATTGGGLLDLEILIANTVDRRVCRAGRHRSWGKANTRLAEPYWAEAHAVPSPSGTRILFGSDWGNGATVDAYVVELPSYRP